MEKLKFPSEIMIEVTNACNNKCFFCGSTISQRRRGEIDEKLLLRLMAEAYNNGARKISFHGMGEPCLCKKLASYVYEAKRMGYTYIYLDTNGVLATQEFMEPVIDAGLDSLKFSIHAATAKTYERITNNDVFEKVAENFKNVSDYIKKTNSHCKLIGYFAESTLNTKEKEMFREMFEPYATELWIRSIHNASGVKADNINYSIDNCVSAMKLPCKELYDRMIVNWEGMAIACSTDWTGNLIYGDTHTAPLDELWNCDKLNSIRNEHNNVSTLNNICKECMGV